MAGTLTTLDGLTKRIYGELTKSLPEFGIVQQLIPFKQKAKTGAEYEEEIVLRRSHGISFQSTNRQTVYSLNAARTMQTKPARTSGAELVMREQVAYGTLAAAEEAGERAYDGALGVLMASIMESHRFYIELLSLYGRSSTGIGVIESSTGSGTTRALVLTSAQWATGIWSQMEGGALDGYDVTGVTKRTANALMSVESVDAATRTINVSGNATDLGNLVAGDFLVPYTSKGETMYGIEPQLINTGSLFGIDGATYGAWRGNTFSAGSAPLTLQTILSAMKVPVGKGLISKKVTALVNEAIFTDLASDAAALRMFTESQKTKVEQGTHSLSFAGSNNNVCDIVSHPMIKQGESLVIVPENFVRGGESDIVNGLPGSNAGDKFWFDLENSAGKEFRQFSSQFLMGKVPSHNVKITNIVPRSQV